MVWLCRPRELKPINPKRREQQMKPEYAGYSNGDQLELSQLLDSYTFELKGLKTTAEYVKMELEKAEKKQTRDAAMKLITEHYESRKILDRILRDIKSNVEKNSRDLQVLTDRGDEESNENFHSSGSASTVSSASETILKGEGPLGTIAESENSEANDALSSRSKVEEWLSGVSHSHNNSDAPTPAIDETNIEDTKLSPDSVKVLIEPLPKKLLKKLRKHKFLRVKEVKCDEITESRYSVQWIFKRPAPRDDSGNTGSSPLTSMETGNKGSNHDDRGSQQENMPTPVEPALVVMRGSGRKRTPARPLSRTIRCVPRKKNRPRTVLIETQEEAEAEGDDYVDPSSGITSSGPTGTKTRSLQASIGNGENRAPLCPDNKLNRESLSSPRQNSKTEDVMNHWCEKCGERFRFWSEWKLHLHKHI